jgi:hypothetical protein
MTDRKEKFINYTEKTTEQRLKVYNYIMNYRLGGYGNYIYAEYKKLMNKKARLKEKIKRLNINDLNWNVYNLSRFYMVSYDDFKSYKVRYCVGQSENEEIINMMERLIEKE